MPVQPQSSPSLAPPSSLEILGQCDEATESMLTDDALSLLGELVAEFKPRIDELLATRQQRQQERDAGAPLDFLEETRAIREGEWTVAPLPPALLKRKVEITGPVERKMIINALNSGADVFMADFEDSCAPSWRNVIAGQVNLRDAVNGDISFISSDGRSYQLNDQPATLMVRPRGLHLVERHVHHDGRAIPAALFDFAVYLHHNARPLLDKGAGPYFYLPKLESHHEARLWNDIFLRAQEAIGLEPGTIKATVLIETLPATFEMDEILYELREHSAGLNCGRWDYIFSYIKTFRSDPARCLPDRAAVGMTQPYMRAYTQLVVKTCHKRNVHAMGGMAAQIPIKSDPEANELAMQRVREDKQREARDGHDGTWVAHPALVPVARDIFDSAFEGPNQWHVKREDLSIGPDELLQHPTGPCTETGLRHNIRVGVQYLQAWLSGNGCVPLYHLMEDAATAEISRAQIWQWIHHRASLDDGTTVTPELVQRVMAEELAALRSADVNNRLNEAAELFQQLVMEPSCAEFLTTGAYERLND